MKATCGMAALLMLAGLVNEAAAQAWPQKPIRVIVGAAAGGGSDTMARTMSEPVGRALGQPIVVENRAGADGLIAGEACAKAAPDGYTLCASNSGLIIFNMAVRSNPPYDSLRDLTPVVQVGFFDSVLVVHPSLPVNSLQQLFDYAKANPSKVNWGHNGRNDTGFMYEEWLKRTKGIPFFEVSYKTQPQVNMAVVSGETQVTFNAIGNLAAQIKAGKLRPLGVNSSHRIGWLPDVPTFDEQGVKLPLRNWVGYHYPINTPREIVVRMNTEIRAGMAQPQYRTVLERLNINPALGTPEEFDAFVRKQLKEVRELIADIGLKPQ
jgi:tripartite-type tricarboxylate transporter receptor subunit TctC